MKVESTLLGRVAGIRHAFFTRRGGVSEGPYASLNTGLASGDLRERVLENHTRICRTLGIPPERLAQARQVHGTHCLEASAPWPVERAPAADALYSDRPGVALGVRTADCAPVLLADPATRRIAAVHAGWRGLLGGVLEATIARFVAAGTRPADLLAAVGPCIGHRSYEVGPEFEEAFVEADPGHAAFFLHGRATAARHFDLEGCVAYRLERCGLSARHIERMSQDTAGRPDLWFSCRRNRLRGEARFGVQMSVILRTE